MTSPKVRTHGRYAPRPTPMRDELRHISTPLVVQVAWSTQRQRWVWFEYMDDAGRPKRRCYSAPSDDGSAMCPPAMEVIPMPTFSTLPIGEARARSATGKRAALLQEYVGYIERVAPGEAGKLEAGAGETTQAIRRRLNGAAEALGKRLEFRRTDNVVYFWSPEGRRRGRTRKNPVD